MKAVLQFITGTTEEWSINPKPYDSVLCIEKLPNGKRLLKLGNGKDRWNNLGYVDKTYIKGLPENLDALAVSIADEEARALLEEGVLQENINHEAEARAETDNELREAVEAAQETADDNDIAGGELLGDIDSLKITLTKAGGETVDIPLADLQSLFLRRLAANGNGSTSLNNDPANEGFSAISTETDTNSAAGIETNTRAGNPAAAGMYLRHNVNPEDNVRILLLNNGVTKRAYLLKDKAVPAAREDIDPNDEMWNRKEVEDAINSAVAGIGAGLKTPTALALESELPDPAEAEAGDYYRISNMDESAPNHSGEAWFNPEVAADAWQKVINTSYAPDGVTLELNGDGEMAIRADVQALIDGAVQQTQLIKPYTYRVDSDEALGAWAANTAGNDYTSVLITAGTWESDVEVNLTAAGTKVVVGMPGSKLVFTSQYGLRYPTRPADKDYRMEGVTVEAGGSDETAAFYNCANLINCSGTGNLTGTGYGYGFYGCANLINCAGYGTADGGTGAGFYNCLNLTNCAGHGLDTGEGAGAGFYTCGTLTNCAGSGVSTGTGSGYGFYGCQGMLLNKAGTASTTAVYDDTCFVSITGTGPAPADTALGGYNQGAGTPGDPLPIANGGTGAATAAEALTALGAAAASDLAALAATLALDLAAKAPLASPEFTGTPRAPTAAAGTNTTQVATTAFVQSAVVGGKGISPFTFLVDSNAKLAAWANKTAGNDYTSVLIAPGTWTSSVEVNLTTAGTKVVVGMPGSKLVFTSQYGLRYTTAPTTNDYRMEGVNVEASSSEAASRFLFLHCVNLMNCTGAMSAADGSAFAECKNLMNCTGTAIGFTGGTGSETSGFSNCKNLTNCIGRGTATGSDAKAYGISRSTNLTNCTGGAISEDGTGYCFGMCRGMLLNQPGATGAPTATYDNFCYVSLSGTGAAPADTAAGGWNKV